jgi:hypothetical protein
LLLTSHVVENRLIDARLRARAQCIGEHGGEVSA